MYRYRHSCDYLIKSSRAIREMVCSSLCYQRVYNGRGTYCLLHNVTISVIGL